VFICFVFISSCNSQRPERKQEIGVKNSKIKEFLDNDSFEKLRDARIIVQFEIEKKLVEGTKDEYSNELILKDTLSISRIGDFLNDSAYN